MSWSEVTITQSGERILSRMLNGAKLIFTRVVIGSETVNEQALPAQTSVFAPIDVPALIAGKTEIEGKNGTQIKIQIRNDGVTEATRMKQIGLYAKTEHDDEVLFGILQDEIGEEIPTFEDFSQFLIELWAVVAISRTNNIQIAESPLVYVTSEQLAKVQDELETKISDCTTSKEDIANAINKSVEISSRQTPAAGVKTHYYAIADCSYTPRDSNIPDTPENVADGYLKEPSGEVVRASVNGDDGISPLAIKF